MRTHQTYPAPSLAESSLSRTVAALALFGTSVLAQPAPSAASPQVVVIKEMRFNPAEIVAKPGDTVEWKNEDIFSHTVTANDGSFDSGPIAPGSSWKLSLKAPVAVAYHCRPHPNMLGRLSVPSDRQSQHSNAGQEHEGSLRWSPPARPEQLHPILVNFTAALLPLAFFSDVIGRISRRGSLNVAGFWMTLYVATITPLTAAAGWWWKRSSGSEMHTKLIVVHQWLGSAAVLLFLVLAIWRWRAYRREVPPGFAYFAFELATLIALVYQGSLGGAMVFGH